jgi:hypothetical protein
MAASARGLCMSGTRSLPSRMSEPSAGRIVRHKPHNLTTMPLPIANLVAEMRSPLVRTFGGEDARGATDEAEAVEFAEHIVRLVTVDSGACHARDA